MGSNITAYLVDCYRHEDISLIERGEGGSDELARRARFMGHTIRRHARAGRLMELARREILKEDGRGRDMPSGIVWWAGSLAGSRGRMGRIWWAPEGGLYLCVAIFPELTRKNRGLYTLAAGTAVAGVLRSWGVEARPRWINDILVKDRKVAGILAESVWCPDAGQEYILIGMGVNVNIHRFPDHLPCASSLALETGCQWDIVSLGAHIIARLSLEFAQLHKWEADSAGEDPDGSPANPVVTSFRLMSDDVGRRVVYGHDVEMAPETEAVIMGLHDDGALLLAVDDNEVIRVNSGEIRYLSGDMIC